MGKHGIDDLVYSKAREVVYEQVKWTATEKAFRSRIHEKRDSKFSDCLADAIADSTIGSVIGIPVQDRDSIFAIAEGKNYFTEDEDIESMIKLPVVLEISTVVKMLTTVRLVDCGMTEVDESLRGLKNLRLLNLSKNRITKIPGKFLPRKIRFLELYMNEISDVRPLTDSIPKTLVHLGLARNKLNDNSGLKSLTKNKKTILRSLDIANNDIENLKLFTSGLASLPLTSLLMEGNPCSMHPSYMPDIMTGFPKLLYLDGAKLEVVKSSEANTSNGGLIFRCYRLTGLRDRHCEYYVELEIPLFDPVRRLAIIEAILEKRKTAEDALRFPTERLSWRNSLDFPDLIIRVPYYAGLTELRDIFRSTVFIRIMKTGGSERLVAEFEVELESVPWWVPSIKYKWENGWKTAIRICEEEEEDDELLGCYLSFAVERSNVELVESPLLLSNS